MPEQDARPWSSAWAEASYGERGFWTAGPGAVDGPAAHFRTSTHVGEVLGAALARLVDEVDRRLGRPDRLDLVDVGAGDGALLAAILHSLPEPDRVRARAVDVRPAPSALDPRVGWRQGPAPDAVPDDLYGVLLAHELLDEVPLDVVELDASGRARLVLVRPDGEEALGPALEDHDACAALGVDGPAAEDWLQCWWPLREPGSRAEVGLPRDGMWRSLVSRVRAGSVLAIDYGHQGDTRSRHPLGTLAGFRDGRPAPARPDGSVGLTAHVAVDSLAAATGATVADQRAALGRLGVDASLPDPSRADYAAALQRTSHAAELLDPSGLGRWSWVRVDV